MTGRIGVLASVEKFPNGSEPTVELKIRQFSVLGDDLRSPTPALRTYVRNVGNRLPRPEFLLVCYLSLVSKRV